MAKAKFKTGEWTKINNLVKTSAKKYGLPQKRDNSVVIGTFNICELSKVKSRSTKAWNLLKRICERFDLLAIQEVADNLEGIWHLKSLLGPKETVIIKYKSNPHGILFNLGDIYTEIFKESELQEAINKPKYPAS